MSTSPNRAVKAHLKRITESERSRTVRWMLRVRAVIAAVYLAQNVWYAVAQSTAEAVATTWVFVAYVLVSVTLMLVADRSAFVLRHAGWSSALLDVPTVTMAAYISAPVWATGKPEHALFSLLPFLAVCIAASTLSLDVAAIAATTAAACAGALIVIHSIGSPITEMTDPALALVSLGLLSFATVRRIRTLVQESRRKDFAGKYVLGERIGAGGMAEVFEATYSPEGSFERRVAVKRVLPAYASDTSFIALFRREAEVGARLAHPNLVQVLDFGKHEDSYFLAMEYIEGVSLSVVLRTLQDKGEHLPLATAHYLIAEVAEALAYLQERPSPDGLSVGLVHRDLNPPNVLLSRTGEVKVSDFGVARWADSKGMTQTGAVRGKLAYMAPEQIGGAAPTPSGDLFALGAMAFELITGQRLFTSQSDAELLRLVLDQPLVPPSSLRPEVPADVDAMVLGLLERDPTKRTASGRQVTQALRALPPALAPYPTGREQLVALLANFSFKAGPLPPSASPRPKEQATKTLNTVPKNLS